MQEIKQNDVVTRKGLVSTDEVDLNAKIFVFTDLEFDCEGFRKFCPFLEDHYLIKNPVRMSSLVETVESVLN